MKTLRQSVQKSEQTSLIVRGRLVRVNMILPIVVGRLPRWLEILLSPYKERFAQEWCPDYWAALFRLTFIKEWQTRWGSVEGQEWFVSSESIVLEDEQRTLAKMAKELKIDMGMSVEDRRHLFAPKGTWSRR